MSENEAIILMKKVWEHKRMAELATYEELYEQAIQNYNFALEMLMKAVLVKNDCRPPSSHSLLVISNTKTSSNMKILRNAINSARFIRPQWDKIHSMWSAGMRYRNLGLTTQDSLDCIEAYERVYKWIESRFF